MTQPVDNAVERKQVTRAAGVVGGMTLASRILGYARDMVFAYLFGTTMAADAFIAAFRIPNLLRRLFGEGSLSIAFVPVFTDYLASGNRKEAMRFARSTFHLLAIVLLLVACVGVALSPWIVRCMAYGFTSDPVKFDLAVNLTRIMLPYIFFIGLVALSMGILNALGHFAAPAAAPVMLNLAMIGSAVAFALVSDSVQVRITGLAIGVIAGGVAQLALQVPFLVRKKVGLGKPAPLFHPGLKKIAALMGPAVFGAAVYQINLVVNTQLASLLTEGSVAFLYYADRIVQFPLGIFAIATATAVLPSLSQQAARNDLPAMKDTFRHGLKLVFFAILPSLVGLIVLRRPIVAVLFRHGVFDLESTRMTAAALFYYAIGLWAFSAVRILLNFFYALQDTRTPVKAAAISIAGNIILGIGLMGPMGHAGLALATSLASMINLTLLIIWLRRKMGPLGGMSLLKAVSRSAACAVVMGIVVKVIVYFWPPMAAGGRLELVVRLMACIISGVGVYCGLAYLLGIEELRSMVETFFRRGRRR